MKQFSTVSNYTGLMAFIYAMVICLFFVTTVNSNQIGVNLQKESIGAIGDLEFSAKDFDFAFDAQVQKTDTLSAILNGSVEFSIIRPFVSFNRLDSGNILDAGAVINFNIKGIDIAGGASFRGVNPVEDTGLDGFDKDGNAIKYFTEDPSNTYQIPDINNINGVFKTRIEKWGIETGLKLYTPITQRDEVPTILISRSQTGIDLADGLALSFILDARTYLHKDGAEIELTPLGNLVFRF